VGRRTDPSAATAQPLLQLLNPSLVSVGVDESHGYDCATTSDAHPDRFSGARQIFTVPSDGATGVPYAETAGEWPETPGDTVGLPQPTTTGYNIMAYAVGGSAPTMTAWGAAIWQLTAASLTGPDGAAVELRTVDAYNSSISAYMEPGSAFLIPVKPLAPASLYHVSVSFLDRPSKQTVTHAWSFTTAAAPVVPPKPVKLGISYSRGTVILGSSSVRPTQVNVFLTSVGSGQRIRRKRTLTLHALQTRLPLRTLFPKPAPGRYTLDVVFAHGLTPASSSIWTQITVR
jgi:hypothetical protein